MNKTTVENNSAAKYEEVLENWVDQKRAAVKLINSTSTLLYDKSIEYFIIILNKFSILSFFHISYRNFRNYG